jgi:predicted peptidase
MCSYRCVSRFLAVIAFVAVPLGLAWADEPAAGKQVKQTLEAKVSDDLRPDYWLYLPEKYDASKDQKWPLVLFLHGAGERGDDPKLVKIHGPPKLADKKAFPFILVSPQCVPKKFWVTESVGKLLDEVTAKHRVDKDRIYVTGLSMGGFGTWNLAAAYPDRFAAIVPICGGGKPDSAEKIKHIPAWVFHGAKDGAVKLERSQAMVDALKAAGGEPKFTIYPDAGHDSWTETYNNPEVYDWLLKQKRKADKAKE